MKENGTMRNAQLGLAASLLCLLPLAALGGPATRFVRRLVELIESGYGLVEVTEN